VDGRAVMSTLLYGVLANKKKRIGTEAASSSPTSLGTYINVLAALVPAEVLAVHAIVLLVTTRVAESTTTIYDPATLKTAFWVLVGLSAGLYAIPRLFTRTWERLDWTRVAIPPFAFAGWTMLNRATAFDAAFPGVREAPRTLIGVVLAVILGLVAAKVASKET
jgi:hypothetical protein